MSTFWGAELPFGEAEDRGTCFESCCRLIRLTYILGVLLTFTSTSCGRSLWYNCLLACNAFEGLSLLYYFSTLLNIIKLCADFIVSAEARRCILVGCSGSAGPKIAA